MTFDSVNFHTGIECMKSDIDFSLTPTEYGYVKVLQYLKEGAALPIRFELLAGYVAAAKYPVNSADYITCKESAQKVIDSFRLITIESNQIVEIIS